jgi:hypothetical protein
MSDTGEDDVLPETSTVTEDRTADGRTAVGQVVLAAGASPQVEDRRAAAARAWLSIAEVCVEDGDGDAACRAASSGLDELGDAYLGDEVEDDTSLKLLAAEDGHANGAAHAGTAMVRVLSDRLAMYAEAQGGRVLG